MYRQRRPWDRSRFSIERIGCATIIAFAIVFCLAVWGWVLNIIHLFQMDSVMTGEGAVRIAGIPIAPIGVILGWFF